ncbi:hypothetical protein [Archangium lansingense]|uniref:Uncharacterized protein n=1 Tax=Archangium lansingense TaxID=2995310 RepID=A0ABT4ABU5_9BACT|nr:hypothetical protein [Archangium lansinium]MCY1079153.1 hypothetical protein [Archangium lansinium]
MGTRGAGGAQGQQPGVGFQGQQPGVGFQGQVGPQQGVGMTQPGDINAQEKMVLRGVLDILKECRVALTRGADDEMDELMEQRQTAAQAYLSGFLEAKGQQEVGGYLSTIPPLSTRGVADDGEYDDMIDDLEGLLNDETRGFWSVAAPIIWDAAKIAARSKTGQEIGRKVKGRLKRFF